MREKLSQEGGSREHVLDSTLESVDGAEEAALEAARWAGFGEDDQVRIGMAVREAMVNAVVHGNRYSAHKKVRFSVAIESSRFIARIADDGEGFDYQSLPDPLAEENLLQSSGRGIFLIRSFVDEFQVRRRSPGGTEVTLIKHRILEDSRQVTGEEGYSVSVKISNRQVGDVSVVDVAGRITLGDGSSALRDAVRDLVGKNQKKILLNLADVSYIDSSGIGELVSGFTTVTNNGGQLKLLKLTKRVQDLLQITKLYTVFDVHEDEAHALRSFA
jgi:anti-anti-sigma factor